MSELLTHDRSFTNANCSTLRLITSRGDQGKSALVNEFIRQTENKHSSKDDPGRPVLARGKFTEQSTASVPFSAITEVLEHLSAQLASGETEGGETNNTVSDEVRSKVRGGIQDSELIGPGREGNAVLRQTYPGIAPLLGGASEEECSTTVHPSMDAIKETTSEILSVISHALDHPLVIFIDDLQWGDAASFDMLQYLLSRLRSILFVCAYRDNEVDEDHPFAKLMDGMPEESAKKMDLYSLSPEAITSFIADSVRKEKDEGVAELAEAVYSKTMGNIFFVQQALEELVRKNILFYDVMMFEWRWVVSKVDLANYISEDVVASVKHKLMELPAGVQHLLFVMSYITHNAVDSVMIKPLVGDSYDESTVEDLLKQACDEGMLLRSVSTKTYTFAHDRIRQASAECAMESNTDHELPLYIAQVLMDFAQGPSHDWCLFVAVDILNALPAEKMSRVDLINLNLRVSRLAVSKGAVEKENHLLNIGLKWLNSSGIMWKGEYYSLTRDLYDAVIKSDYSLGKSKSESGDFPVELLPHVASLFHIALAGGKPQATTNQQRRTSALSFPVQTP